MSEEREGHNGYIPIDGAIQKYVKSTFKKLRINSSYIHEHKAF